MPEAERTPPDVYPPFGLAPNLLPESTYPMKSTSVVPKIAVPAITLLLGGASLLFASPAFAEEDPTSSDTFVAPVDEGVCEDLDTGHLYPVDTVAELEIFAPEGELISGYCVKAGSIVQGDGPEFYAVDPPQQSVTISHKSGKDISHYSVSYVPEPTPTPTPEPTPEPTPTPTEPPAGGGDGGAELAETGFDAGWLPFVGIGALALGAALVVPRLGATRR